MSHTQLIKTIFIAATPEHVWLYLTDKNKLGEWFQPATKNLKQGQTYKLLNDAGGDMCWGRVIEATPPLKLTYTFSHDHLAGVETTVEWALCAVHGGTMVTLTHYGFEDADTDTLTMLISHDKGWDAHFSRLREFAAQ